MDDLSQIVQTLNGAAQSAAEPVISEPGPGSASPTTNIDPKKPGQNSLVTLQMEEEQLGKWFERVERARQRVDALAALWDILLDEFLPTVTASGIAEATKVNRHFRDVASKIGQLFYRSPDVVLLPDEMSPAQNQMPNPMQGQNPGQPLPPLTMEDIIGVKQEVLKKKLGRDGLKAGRLMDELLFDVLAWAGIACCKVGYRCVQKQIPRPVTQPDPTFQQPPPAMGSVLGLSPVQQPPMVPKMGPDGQPMTEMVPVTIFDEVYARRFSPKKLLFDEHLRSTRLEEDATWVGMDFYMTPEDAKKPVEKGGMGLTDDEASGGEKDDRIHVHPREGNTEGAANLLHFIEIFCKASYFTDEAHPQAINQLIICTSVRNRPIAWRPSPDQTFDELGKLTEDSLLGFPIMLLSIRDLADSPFPDSDAAYTNTGIKTLSTFMRQRIRQRDANIGKILFDTDAFDKEDIDLLKNAETGEYVGVKPGSLDKGVDKVLAQTTQIKNTPDDVRTEELLRRDLDETVGIGAVQSGNPEQTVHTATEISSVGQAIAARNDKELSRVVDFYLDLVRKIDTLLMRYTTTEGYVEITGEEGAKRMQLWNKSVISGRWIYDIAPDSQLKVDTARDFQLTMTLYNMAAKDPLFNRAYVLKRLARMRGLDPGKAILPPQPPPPPKPALPEGVSLGLKAEDTAIPAVQDILIKSGIVDAPPNRPGNVPQGGGLPQPAGAGAPPPLPKPSQPIFGAPHPQGDHTGDGEAVNQHHASNSGGKPNAPGAMNHREELTK